MAWCVSVCLSEASDCHEHAMVLRDNKQRPLLAVCAPISQMDRLSRSKLLCGRYLNAHHPEQVDGRAAARTSL